jgi:uncharacterized protein (DUF305 family)
MPDQDTDTTPDPATGVAGDDHDLDDAEDPGAGDDGDEVGRARRMLDALTPQGPFQVAVGVLALCFLAGALGYVIGTRQSPVPTSAVDQGFLFDMSDHHEQANDMALCAVNRADDQLVQHMALEVLTFQNRDLARMASLLEQMLVERDSSEGRTAMEWMGMPTPVGQMPGMATAAQLDELCSSRGRETDRLFLTLMREHHRGGIHMAEMAANEAANPSVRSFARNMARNQAIEVNEYTAHLKRLGLER